MDVICLKSCGNSLITPGKIYKARKRTVRPWDSSGEIECYKIMFKNGKELLIEQKYFIELPKQVTPCDSEFFDEYVPICPPMYFNPAIRRF